MINVRELRVGNFVSNEKGALIVIDGRSIFDLWSKTGILKHLPIPITEDWLLRFGFASHATNLFWFKKDILCVSLIGRIELVSWNRQLFQLTEIEIKFVHQLQNLYFALTGEELKLNEK